MWADHPLHCTSLIDEMAERKKPDNVLHKIDDSNLWVIGSLCAASGIGCDKRLTSQPGHWLVCLLVQTVCLLVQTVSHWSMCVTVSSNGQWDCFSCWLACVEHVSQVSLASVEHGASLTGEEQGFCHWRSVLVQRQGTCLWDCGFGPSVVLVLLVS